MTVPSLAFRLLDVHVVQGRADEPALVTGDRTLTYAQLLHESASLAGGLRELGVGPGTPLHVDVADARLRVLVILALVRLGAEPDPTAGFRVAGDPPVVSTPDEQFEVDLVLRAGRVDPAVALPRDSEGYEARVRAHYEDLVAVLLGGGTLG